MAHIPNNIHSIPRLLPPISNIGGTYGDGGDEMNGGESFKIENKNGDVLLFTPKELRLELKQYIEDELRLFSSDGVADIKKNAIENIESKLKLMEKSLLNHIDNKFNKITETIIESILNHKFEEEVNRRLNAKLEKIKNSL